MIEEVRLDGDVGGQKKEKEKEKKREEIQLGAHVLVPASEEASQSQFRDAVEDQGVVQEVVEQEEEGVVDPWGEGGDLGGMDWQAQDFDEGVGDDSGVFVDGGEVADDEAETEVKAMDGVEEQGTSRELSRSLSRPGLTRFSQLPLRVSRPACPLQFPSSSFQLLMLNPSVSARPHLVPLSLPQSQNRSLKSSRSNLNFNPSPSAALVKNFEPLLVVSLNLYPRKKKRKTTLHLLLHPLVVQNRPSLPSLQLPLPPLFQSPSTSLLLPRQLQRRPQRKQSQRSYLRSRRQSHLALAPLLSLLSAFVRVEERTKRRKGGNRHLLLSRRGRRWLSLLSLRMRTNRREVRWRRRIKRLWSSVNR